MTAHIAVVDYGMGNRRSVEKALLHVGARAEITADPEVIGAAHGVVVPGVGAFPQAMRNLRESGLDAVIVDRARAGVPLLGICLGMQLLFERSTEHEGADGLGLLPGTVTALEAPGRKIPHIGWNLVTFERETPLTAGLPERCAFYHVHSFVVRPSDGGDVVGQGEYGEHFVSAVGRDPVYGVQFHPEKSSVHGLALLANFTAISTRVTA